VTSRSQQLDTNSRVYTIRQSSEERDERSVVRRVAAAAAVCRLRDVSR
jgi:hypothetical protein